MNVMSKTGELDNVLTYTHVCDTKADLQNIPREEAPIGSRAKVLRGASGNYEEYMVMSDGTWVLITMSTSGGGGGSGVDLSNDTVDAQHLIYGYTAHDHTETAITGEIEIRDHTDVITEGGTTTIPAGWYESTVTIQDNSPDSFDADADNLIFIDYTGDILYRYTTEEALALTALPANPTHEGLVPQGWNWTLNEIQNYLTAYPIANVVVGQLYDTVSGATEILINLDQLDKLSPVLCIPIPANTSATIDWGDGTVEQVGDTTAVNYVPHTYATTGHYIIKFTADSDAITIGVRDVIKPKIFADQINSTISAYYDQTIEEMHININLDAYPFTALCNLKYITFSDDVHFRENDSANNQLYCACRNDYSLRAITLPRTVTTLYDTFQNAYNLRFCSVANTLTYIHADACFENTALKAFTFSTTLTTIDNGVQKGIIADTDIKKLILPDALSVVGYMCATSPNLITVHLPTSWTILPTYNLYYASSIKELIIPDNVTEIGTYACYSMTRLQKVTIGSKITSIKGSAFASNSSLLEFHIATTTPPTLQYSAFNYTTPLLTIYVPYSADHSVLTAYKNATNWSTYADQIQEEPQS